jgi:hypothetical protein
VLVLIAFDCHDPIGLVSEEVDSGELLRSLTAERDHGFTVRRITNGCEELVQPFLPFLFSLVSSFSVVPFEVSLQSTGLDVAGLTVLGSTHERTVVVMNHRVVRPVLLLQKSGPAARDVALVRPLTRMSPLVLGGVARTGRLLATLFNPAEKLTVGEPLPLRSSGLTRRCRWRWAGSL